MKQPITKGQLTKIHVLLNQCGMMASKSDLVSGASNGRTESSKELSQSEAKGLLQYLATFDELQPMRLKVFALAYNAGIIYGETPADKKMNAAKLNKFLREKGTCKKELNHLNRQELIKTVSQFEMIVKHTKQAGDNKEAAKATDAMLSEMGIEKQVSTSRTAKKSINSSND